MKSYSLRLNDDEYDALCYLRENGINVQEVLKKELMSEKRAFDRKAKLESDKNALIAKVEEAKERYEKNPPKLYYLERFVGRVFGNMTMYEKLVAQDSSAITWSEGIHFDILIEKCRNVKSNKGLHIWNDIVNHILSEEEKGYED